MVVGKLEKESEVAQSCLTLCDPMDCSLPGSSIHGIIQARELEWVAIAFSRGSSQPRDRTWVSHIVDRHFTFWATTEVKLQRMNTIERYLGSKIREVSFSLEKDKEREIISWMTTGCQAFVTVWLHWSGNYIIWYWQCYRWLDLKGDTDYDFILNVLTWWRLGLTPKKISRGHLDLRCSEEESGLEI